MRVHLGSDHAGFELKQHLAAWAAGRGYEVSDHGPSRYDDADDYPVYCLRTALAVSEDLGSLGIVVGGSGNGEQIAANKVPGVRAALAWSVETARLAREHNDANVLGVGARMHPESDVVGFVEAFLTTTFGGAERHARRIEMLRRFEKSGELPPLP